MNILIVESENDQYFVDTLAKEISSENRVCRIGNSPVACGKKFQN